MNRCQRCHRKRSNKADETFCIPCTGHFQRLWEAAGRPLTFLKWMAAR